MWCTVACTVADSWNMFCLLSHYSTYILTRTFATSINLFVTAKLTSYVKVIAVSMSLRNPFPFQPPMRRDETYSNTTLFISIDRHFASRFFISIVFFCSFRLEFLIRNWKMDFFEVEKVLKKKVLANNQVKYLIKWVGDAQPSWVFDFDCKCNKAIRDYEISQLAEFLGKPKLDLV